MSNNLMTFNFLKKVKSPYARAGEMNLGQQYELRENNSDGFLEIKRSWLDVGNNENERIFFAALDAKDLIISYLQDGDYERADEFGQLLNDAYLARRHKSGGRESIPKLSDFEDILGGAFAGSKDEIVDIYGHTAAEAEEIYQMAYGHHEPDADDDDDRVRM